MELSVDPVTSDKVLWSKLLYLIARGQVIPIIGRDLLRVTIEGSQQLLHEYLATALGKQLGVPLPEGANLDQVVVAYLALSRQHRRADIYPVVTEILGQLCDSSKGVPTPEPLLKLAAIRPLRLFVTTTADSFLARALGVSRDHVLAYAPNSEITDIPSDYTRSQDPYVFHLFGRISAIPDSALLEEETLEFLWSLHEESLTRRLGNLFDELRTRTLLLIGNGQPDWLARFFVRLARRGRLSSGDEAPHEFFADEEVAADIHLRDFLQNFSYQTSIFSARHPIEFVDQLAQRWEDYPDKPLPIRGAPAIPASAPPAIFLSYARQDGAAVERLAHQLDAAGLDTWYDRARLSSGDPWWPVIDRNIATCVIFVPVISVHTNARDEGVFLREWNRAIERFNDMNKLTARFIHPVLIDDSLADNVTFGSFRAFQFTRAPDGKAAPEFIDYLIKLVRERRARRLVQL